jgi:crotonyl-CoA carboxylase/reductase
MTTKQIYDLGEMPPLGTVPEKMHAFLVRQDRFGEPESAWQREVIDTPKLGPKDVLVYVMASGINYNNVWAALGYPVDVIKDRQKKGEPEDFHAGGSDASGIVWAVGEDVLDVKIGEEVVVHSGWWEPEDPWVLTGKDPMLAASVRIWGYQTNYGSYCQFAKAQSHQIKKKAEASDMGRGGVLYALCINCVSSADGLGTAYCGRRRCCARLGCSRWPGRNGAADCICSWW